MAEGDIERVYYYKRESSRKCAMAVSASVTMLAIEQPNVMRVTKFWETPEPRIVMDYYPLGNFVDGTVIDEDQYVSAMG